MIYERGRAEKLMGLRRSLLGATIVVLLSLSLAPGSNAFARPAEGRVEPEDERPAAGMKARVFQLKHREPDDVIDLIKPLLSDRPGSTIRASDGLRTIAVRDFPENLAAVDVALRKLDLPQPLQPDVEVQVRILIGSPLGGASQYPAELEPVVKQLGSTLNYRTFFLVGSVTQRLRAGSKAGGKSQVIPLAPGAEEKITGHFHYRIDNLSVTPPSTANGLASFALKEFRVALEADALGEAEVATGLTLREGEKVVVGTASLKNRAMIVVVFARRLLH
jgi:hypothetical protein